MYRNYTAKKIFFIFVIKSNKKNIRIINFSNFYYSILLKIYYNVKRNNYLI